MCPEWWRHQTALVVFQWRHQTALVVFQKLQRTAEVLHVVLCIISQIGLPCPVKYFLNVDIFAAGLNADL